MLSRQAGLFCLFADFVPHRGKYVALTAARPYKTN